MERRWLLHRLLAYTLVGLILAWGVLLSPPMKGLREALGLPGSLPGGRFYNGVYHVEPLDPGLYFARLTFYYHSLFAALVYATLAAALAPPITRLVDPDTASTVLLLAAGGALATAAGGLGYAYCCRLPVLHGLFILGLSLLFAAGLIIAARARPRGASADSLLYLSLLLLLAGAVIGGYVGSSFMEPGVREELVKAIAAARIDPSKAEHVSIWRAVVAHEHAMIAIMDAASLALILAILKPRGRWVKPAYAAAALGLTVTAVASYLVWPLGGVAHAAITPASLILLVSMTYLVAASGPEEPRLRSLKNAAILGLAAVWAGVVIPGAVVAMSLRHPTLFIHPAFRSSYWDVAENAYNIGHWHILLAAWGTAVYAAALATQPAATEREKKLYQVSMVAAAAALLASSIAANLYMLASGPNPTPDTSPWMPLLDATLAALALAAATPYPAVLHGTLRSRKKSGYTLRKA